MMNLFFSVVKICRDIFFSAYTYLVGVNIRPRVMHAVLEIASEIARRTKNEADNAALAAIATLVRKESMHLSNEDKNHLSRCINRSRRGALKEVKLKISSKQGIALQTSFGGVSYDHRNGNITWSKEIKF